MWSVRCRSNWRTGPTVETVAWKALARNTGRMQIDRSSCEVMKFGEVCIKPHSASLCFGVFQVVERESCKLGCETLAEWQLEIAPHLWCAGRERTSVDREGTLFQHTGHFTTQADAGNTTCSAELLPTVHWHWCPTGFGCASFLSSVLSMSIWPAV